MKYEYDPEEKILRLENLEKPDGWEEKFGVVEVKLGDRTYFVHIFKETLRQRVSLLHGGDLSPENNQEIAFLLQFLRQQQPLFAVESGQKEFAVTYSDDDFDPRLSRKKAKLLAKNLRGQILLEEESDGGEKIIATPRLDWLRDLKVLDQTWAQKIKAKLDRQNGLLKEYLN